MPTNRSLERQTPDAVYVRSLPLAAALALAACQIAPAPTLAPAPEPEVPFYTLTDLTDDFEHFHDRTQGMDTAARVAAFKAEFVPLLPGFYEPNEYTTQEQIDRLITRSLEQFPAIRARYNATREAFAPDMEATRDAFVAAFPDTQPVGNIYFVHSLGRMDGGTREHEGRVFFIFGADVMARIHTPGQARPFFNHEIFHFYHHVYFRECEAVWCSLWSEGLAVHVAEQLNPGASDDALLLNVPRPIRPEVDANLQVAACEVARRLDSEAQEDHAPLFFGNGQPPHGLPPRFGYYVGYLVAREAGETYSIQQLAHMNAEQARPVIDATLASLAECSP